MTIRNAKRWAPRGLWRYGVSVAAAGAALSVRLALHPYLETHMPALFFTLAAIAVGYWLGIWPALLVVALGLPLADFYFVPPFAQFDHIEKSDLILLIGFPLVSCILLWVIESLRRSQQEARLFAEVARSRYDMLLRKNARRKKEMKAARAGADA
jgi:K+-sensing histidine kinase KdpD